MISAIKHIPAKSADLWLNQHAITTVAAAGDYAYVGSYLLGGDISLYPPRFRVLDIADLDHPEIVGVVNVPDVINDIKIQNGFAYVCAIATAASWSLISIRLKPPQLVARCDETLWMGEAVVDDTIAYFAAGFDGLKVYNISDPVHLEEIGSLPARRYYSQLAQSGTTFGRRRRRFRPGLDRHLFTYNSRYSGNHDVGRCVVGGL